MEPGWTNEGMEMNNWTFGRNRPIWEASGKNRVCGGEFSILQIEDTPDKLVIQANEEYGQELSRRDVKRLIRNLRVWLDSGDATCPRVGDGPRSIEPEGCDDGKLDRTALELIGKAAEGCDVEKVVLRIDSGDEGEICWSFFVIWGRETAYTDTMRFLDMCGWAGDYADFYFSEETRDIRKYRDSVFQMVYERRVADKSA